MFLTGRTAILVATGIVPVILVTAAAASVPGVSPGVVAWGATAVWVLFTLGVLVLDVRRAGDPRAIEVARTIPARARLGQTVEVAMHLRNTGTRRVRGQVRDAWQPTAGAPHERIPVDLEAGSASSRPFTLVPRRRGELRSEFVVVRSTGPWGLGGRQGTIAAPAALRVLPPFASRRHLPSRLARLRELDGSTSVQLRGEGTEFDSLREYVGGDDVRSIDWRATARSRTTMLRTWRPERDRHVVIVIDTGRTSAGRVGDATRLDAAMEAALLLAALADRAGDHVHLLMFDRLVRARVTGRSGAALLPALVDAMSETRSQLIDTDWHAALSEAARLTTRPSLTVLLTSLDAAAASRALLGALPRLSKRGRVIVGSVTDERLRAIAATRTTSDDVWRAAAAERAVMEAGQLSDAVSRIGADAVSAGPDELPPLIADRYLRLKAIGRL